MLLVSPPARSLELVNLAVESLEASAFEVQGMATEIDLSDDNQVIFKASAQMITHEEFGRFSEVRFTCPAVFRDREFRCREGRLSARHGEQGVIEARLDLTYGIGRGYSGDIRITASELLLQAFEPIWRRYSETDAGQKAVSGHVTGSLDLELIHSQLRRVTSTLEFQNVSFEGENVLESVTMKLGLEGSRVNGTWDISSTIRAMEGLMYIVPGFEVLGDRPGFYLDLNDTDLELAASGRLDETRQLLTLTAFRYMHPQRLQLSGQAVFDTAANTAKALVLDIWADDLSRVYPVYVEPLLLATNFYDLEIAGSLRLGLDYRNESLARLHLVLDDVYLDDADQRFSLSGLSTDMLLGETVHDAVSSLQWQSMSVYKLVFGAGDITMQTGGGDVTVIDWQDVDVLDGTLLINQLSLDDIGNRDFRLSLHGELTPVSLKTFTQNMGWPLLSGKLSGQIDGLEYQHGDLRVNGDFAFRVFDGKVLLEGLRIENLFNINSRLYTNVTIRDLDLEQITDTFSFGKIQGSLEGYVRDLTLVNWRPVYFDAVLRNPEDDRRPHRISQKALDNLSEIGGGLPGTLSRGFIRFIPEYSYGRLGIRCLLSNNVCNLAGVEETEDGFYIMTRGGLLPPWVDVKAAGRSIIWQDLVGGLKQIAEGEPVFK